jgi:hypothetical protein
MLFVDNGHSCHLTDFVKWRYVVSAGPETILYQSQLQLILKNGIICKVFLELFYDNLKFTHLIFEK